MKRSDQPIPNEPYSLRRLQHMLGLGRSFLVGLIDTGVVAPIRDASDNYRFSFQDLVLLRMAQQLRASRITPMRAVRSLRKLKATLPSHRHLSALRIKAIGNELAIRQNGSWADPTGQLLIDFESNSQTSAPVVEIGNGAGTSPGGTAAQWFERAEALEDTDISGAEHAYRQAIRIAPDHENAYINLGALLCEAKRCEEAVALFDAALQTIPSSSVLHFNHAIALEDGGRPHDALRAYERCIALDTDFSDAHFNAARLCIRLEIPQAALRHYNDYRRLQAGAIE